MQWGSASFLLYFVHYLAAQKPPTVLIAVLVRNKAHTLPYFLSLLENLTYPKDRISLWIRSDHNVDNTLEILKKWIDEVHTKYHSVNTLFAKDDKFKDEETVSHWSSLRYEHVMKLREAALMYGRKIWADYLLTIDADVFITNPDMLHILISKNLDLVAPMLTSEGLYSNYWCGMTDDYYYLRTEDYEPILHHKNKSCFAVPMVHSCVLVDLRSQESDSLTYSPEKVLNYNGPRDDIITFALSAKKSGVKMHVCNDLSFGYIMAPLDQDEDLEFDEQRLVNLKLQMIADDGPISPNPLLQSYVRFPKKDKLGFDQIFLINLFRRLDRRTKMFGCFDELGLEVSVVEAVDGQTLNDSYLDNITFLPDYLDPHCKRPMKLGEIGCFLSHYGVWEEVVTKEYEKVLVLEDDVRFEPFFRTRVELLLEELNAMKDWDLVYFGRKPMSKQEEPWVENSECLVQVGYSYWTVGYALSSSGAKKLLEADPFSRLLPVDEYLPILFDKHPNSDWKGHFPKRDLIAFSVNPLLLYPTHYTGQEGYISDTEDSNVVDVPSTSPRSDL